MGRDNDHFDPEFHKDSEGIFIFIQQLIKRNWEGQSKGFDWSVF
jgi:hypothetical protein